jgi:phage tail-like protein
VTNGRGNERWLVDQLPLGMLEDDFFARFAAIFQDVADTLVDAIDTIPEAVDVSVAPAPFVRWLGSWIGADAVDAGDGAADGAGEAWQRGWLRCQSSALAWRGTCAGLETMLRRLCGDPVRVTDGGGVYLAGTCPASDTGWVRIEVPGTGLLTGGDLVRLVRAEVPAHVAVTLLVGGSPLALEAS